MIIPWPESLRQALFWVRQRYKSYPLLERLSTVVEPWQPARTDNLVNNKPPRALFTKPNNLWPCGSKDKPLVLYYSFFQPADNIIQRNRESKIQTIIRHIEEQVPGVKFDLVNDDNEAVIRIAFNSCGKTWSRVGREAERVNSSEPTMNLSDVRHESGEIEEGSREYGDIMQGLFHALGMDHEHQHPERKFTISAIAVGKDKGYDEWSEKDNILPQFTTIGAYPRPDMTSCRKTWPRVRRGTERVNSGEPTMNLSDVTGHESGEVCGCILGMQHEYQHPDRTFDITSIAVGNDIEDDGCSEEDINDNIVKRFNTSTIGGCSRPDMASCMNYRIQDEFTKEEAQKRNKPSNLNFAWLNLMYPTHDPTKFEQAMSVSMDSRISKEQRNAILKLYLDGEWDRVRSRILNDSNVQGVVCKMRPSSS